MASVGLKIALKFLAFTYELPAELESADLFWNTARLRMILLSVAGMPALSNLFLKLNNSQPVVPYLAIIVAGILFSQFVSVPILSVEDVALTLALPILRSIDGLLTVASLLRFSIMSAIIDVIGR
ncbi:MAG: hypothetical protein NNA31_07100 [Nitrospira sp.]|nr:hypothetical protein [Nitrospira sp.]